MTTDLEKLRDLTDRLNQPKGGWKWDIINNVLLWSAAIFPIFGLTRKTFAGTYEGFLDSVHPEDRERVKKAVDRALEGELYSIDHRIVLPDGSEKTVHEEAEVFFDLNTGEAIRMEGMVQDITKFGQNSEEDWRQILYDMVKNGAIEVKDMREQIGKNTVAIARLQETSSAKLHLWNIVAGAIPATILLLILWLTGKL